MDHPEREADEQLISRLAAGDTTALEVLYDTYAGVIFALVMRIVADHELAEEILQEVFVRAWQRAHTYQPARGRVISWLFGIGHHVALNEVRRRRRRPQSAQQHEQHTIHQELAKLPSPDPEPSEAAWATVRRAHLLQALDELPGAQRAVIEMYASGYSQSEIANHLKEPLGTIKSRMRRGLQTLRATLQARGVKPEHE